MVNGVRDAYVRPSVHTWKLTVDGVHWLCLLTLLTTACLAIGAQFILLHQPSRKGVCSGASGSGRISQEINAREPAQVRMSLQKHKGPASLKLPPDDPNLAMRRSKSTDTSGDVKWNWMRPSTSSLRASSISSCASSILQVTRHFQKAL